MHGHSCQVQLTRNHDPLLLLQAVQQPDLAAAALIHSLLLSAAAGFSESPSLLVLDAPQQHPANSSSRLSSDLSQTLPYCPACCHCAYVFFASAGILKGKLDQRQSCLQVHDVASRDLRPTDTSGLADAVGNWCVVDC